MNTPRFDMNILVIDDQRFQRTFIVRLLRELGIRQIHEASNGKNALDLLSEIATPFDLIISDIDMPKMDGLEFLRWLGRMAPETPILIHSALETNLLNSVEAMAVEYGLSPIGILESPVTTENLGEALERALLQAPKGRDKDESNIDAEQVAEGMRKKEFEPWFQPKIDLRTGRIAGVEALLRWRRNEHTLLPSSFLPQLEAAGLMKEVTLRVAMRAAECVGLILDKDAAFTVAINIAPPLLDDPAFATELTAALTSCGAKPEHIIIEVTETAIGHNLGAMLENLARMRMHGFRISLDDFCTGYSSMARLARSPFSEIKIDRSFVSRMYQGNREWLLVESTVALAQRLGLRTVAEGVDSQHQLQALKQFGCDVAQGFLIAKPMSVIELMQWMERNSAHVDTISQLTRRNFVATVDRMTLDGATQNSVLTTQMAADWCNAALNDKTET